MPTDARPLSVEVTAGLPGFSMSQRDLVSSRLSGSTSGPRRSIRGVLALLLSILCAACSFTENRSVRVMPHHLQCVTDADCTEVPLACSSCGDIVARRFVDSLLQERERLCRRYRGPVVDCSPSNGSVCEKGMCVAARYSWQSGQ